MSLKILIVDDSRSMQAIIRRGLGKAKTGELSLDMQTTSSGMEALDLTRTWEPDLILCDWHMPEMTGIDLLRQLNREMLGIRVGFITTETSPDRLAEAREAGALFVINKPFQMEELHNTVIPILENIHTHKLLAPQQQPDDIHEGPIESADPWPSSIINLPNAQELERTLNNYCELEVLTDEIEPVRKLDVYPCMVALLIDETSHKVRGVVVFSLAAAIILGGAVDGKPNPEIQKLIQRHVINKDIHRNCETILRKISALLIDESSQRSLILGKASLIKGSFPRLESILNTPPNSRIDLEVAVLGYGQGTITVVAS